MTDLDAARMHIGDCFADVDPETLTDVEVQQDIERHYPGGWEQFVNDGPVTYVTEISVPSFDDGRHSLHSRTLAEPEAE